MQIQWHNAFAIWIALIFLFATDMQFMCNRMEMHDTINYTAVSMLEKRRLWQYVI